MSLVWGGVQCRQAKSAKEGDLYRMRGEGSFWDRHRRSTSVDYGRWMTECGRGDIMFRGSYLPSGDMIKANFPSWMMRCSHRIFQALGLGWRWSEREIRRRIRKVYLVVNLIDRHRRYARRLTFLWMLLSSELSCIRISEWSQKREIWMWSDVNGKTHGFPMSLESWIPFGTVDDLGRAVAWMFRRRTDRR